MKENKNKKNSREKEIEQDIKLILKNFIKTVDIVEKMCINIYSLEARIRKLEKHGK